jgi:uncharacterized protein CbrC (UPF0167 family)
MAQRCVECPVCTKARKQQRGFVYWFVKNIENGICPYCAAYERVYGKKPMRLDRNWILPVKARRRS